MLPHIGDLAFHLLVILGKSTRPFRPADTYTAVRAVLGEKYSCVERIWKYRIRAGKDRLVKQGLVDEEDGFWISTEAGRLEAEIIARMQAP